MNRRLLSSVLIGALVLTGAACAGSEPEATADDLKADLPQAKEIIDVPVTKPANIQPVNLKDLPPTARVIEQMPNLSRDEKNCANFAIKTTMDGDPTIAKTNGKLASVLGNSIVVCTPPQRLAGILGDGLSPEGGSLSTDQKACLERTITDDAATTGRFLAALLTIDIPNVAAASKKFDEVCQISVVPKS